MTGSTSSLFKSVLCILGVMLYASGLLAQARCSDDAVQLIFEPQGSQEVVQGGQICYDVQVRNFTNVLAFTVFYDFQSDIIAPDENSFINSASDMLGEDVDFIPTADGQISFSWIGNRDFLPITLDDNTVIFSFCMDVIGEVAQSTGLSIGASITSESIFTISSDPDDISAPSIDNFPCDPEPGNTVVTVRPDPSTIPSIYATGLCGTNAISQGIIQLKAFNGTPPYTVTMNGTTNVPAIASDSSVFRIADLPNGTYNFTITDAQGNTSDIGAPLEITESSPFVFDTITLRNPTCALENNGRIVFTVESDNPFIGGEYRYDWINGGGQGRNDTIELRFSENGMYTVEVQDSLGCRERATFELFTPPIEVTVEENDLAECPGGNRRARIRLSATGGTPDPGFGYEWDTYRRNPQGMYEEYILPKTGFGYTDNFPAGDYFVILKDPADFRNICDDTTYFTIGVESDFTAEVVDTDSDNCPSGEAMATIQVLEDGVLTQVETNFTLVDSAGNTVWQGMSATGSVTTDCLPNGQYIAQYSNVSGCADMDTIFIFANTIELVDFNTQNPLCDGDSSGYIIVEYTTDFPPLTYTWFDPVTGEEVASGVGLDSIGGLPAGQYLVAVVDSVGQRDTITSVLPNPLSLINPNSITVDFSSPTGNVACPDDEVSLSPNIMGAQGDVTYVWSPNNPNPGDPVFLARAGNYSVTVTDANGCVDSASTTITSTQAPVDTILNASAPSCLEGMDGEARLLITPRLATDFDIVSSTGMRAVGVTLRDTSFGVTDATGKNNWFVYSDDNCTYDTVFVDIPAPPRLKIDIANSTIPNIQCFGEIEPIRLVSFSDNVTFVWPDGRRTNSRVDLSSGTYILTLEKGACQATDTLVVPGSDSLMIEVDSASSQFAGCNNSRNVIRVNADGGTPDYTYQWTDETGQVLPGNVDAMTLIAGIYSVQVTDANGCRSNTMFELADFQPVTSSLAAVIEPECSNDVGRVLVTEASGGNGGPYSYQVDLGADNLMLGDTALITPRDSIRVVVFDSEGCNWDTIINIAPPSRLDVELGPDITIEQGTSIEIDADITSDNRIDSIIWTPMDSLMCLFEDCEDVEVNPVTTTMYNIRVIDENGCEVQDDIQVSVNRSLNVYVPNVITAGSQSLNWEENGMFRVYTGAGVACVTHIAIYDRYGGIVHQEGNRVELTDMDNTVNCEIPADQDMRQNVSYGAWDAANVNPGVYVYTVQAVYTDGDTETLTGNVTVLK